MTPISIVLPVYNSTKYIDECLSSILKQTFEDFEIIIIDDGSTDDSLIKIGNHNDDRINVIQNKHNYIESLNIGMSVAKGKYIVRMDADDIMMPNRLEIQHQYMETHPNIDICGSSYELIGAKSRVIQHKLVQEQIISALILYNPICHPSIIMRKDLVKLFSDRNVYNKKYLYGEDYKLWTDLAKKGCQFAVLPDILLKYRISDQQVTFLHQKEMQKTTLMIQYEYIKYICEIISKYKITLDNFLFETNTLFQKQLISHRCYQNLIFSLFSEVIYKK